CAEKHRNAKESFRANLLRKALVAEDRKSYQQKTEERLRRLGARIDELLKEVEVRAREEYRRLSETLPHKLKKAQEELERLKAAGDEAWSEFRPGLERAWTDVKDAWEKGSERFRRRREEV